MFFYCFRAIIECNHFNFFTKLRQCEHIKLFKKSAANIYSQVLFIVSYVNQCSFKRFGGVHVEKIYGINNQENMYHHSLAKDTMSLTMIKIMTSITFQLPKYSVDPAEDIFEIVIPLFELNDSG